MGYYYKNKDPIIAIVRSCIRIFQARNNLPSLNAALRELSKAATYGPDHQHVSVSAMDGWLNRKTVSPRFCCVMAVVRATGRDIEVSPAPRTHLKLVA